MYAFFVNPGVSIYFLECLGYFGLARISVFLGDLLSAERNIELGLQGRSFDQMTDDEIVTYWEGLSVQPSLFN